MLIGYMLTYESLTGGTEVLSGESPSGPVFRKRESAELVLEARNVEGGGTLKYHIREVHDGEPEGA